MIAVALIALLTVSLALGVLIGKSIALADKKQAEQQPETEVERWDCAA